MGSTAILMNGKIKQEIANTLIASVEGDLPSFDEIERFAAGGDLPKSCTENPEACAAKILLTLTRKNYPQQKAENLWHAIVEHEKWITNKLGRKSGVSVAALDYLLNVAGDWEEAVVTEVEQMETLADAATIDGLTGLYTREVFDQWLTKSVAESRRYGDALSLLMADIDDFKSINDKHGHQTGDDVLKSIGLDFLRQLRSADFAARYGGEELVAVLPHTQCEAAAKVAEKIRKAVHERYEGQLDVSISIGVACWQDGMLESKDLIQAADKALYKAKTSGKNRVIINSSV